MVAMGAALRSDAHGWKDQATSHKGKNDERDRNDDFLADLTK